jgi:arylsulfatase A-like enzyme
MNIDHHSSQTVTLTDAPNVLFLVADFLRYASLFGNDAIETSTINRLAEDGVVFTKCFSQGIFTAPAMTAMLTGRYPLDYGGHWYIGDDQPTMAQQFRENGYTTAAIHSNPNVSRLRNFHRGFDTFDENILPYIPNTFVNNTPDQLLRYANKFARLFRQTPYLPVEKVNQNLVDWIRSTEEPWFLWTQYMDVHGPYLPGNDFNYWNKFRAERLWRKAAVNAADDITPEEHDELWTNYGKEVEYLDQGIGAFLDRLADLGVLEDTIVIIVGDHGDEFYEHGRYGHGNLPFDELTHVPLIICFPDWIDIDQQMEIDSLVRTIDILPTILDLVDAELSEEMEKRMEGKSLIPVLRGNKPDYDVVVTEKEMRGEDHLRFGFRTTDWKYLYDGTADERHLFDLADDPGNTTGVAGEFPKTDERCRGRLGDRLDRIGRTSADVEIPDVETDENVEERLRALGYK